MTSTILRAALGGLVIGLVAVLSMMAPETADAGLKCGQTPHTGPARCFETPPGHRTATPTRTREATPTPTPSCIGRQPEKCSPMPTLAVGS
jgi:hypothetical protein